MVKKTNKMPTTTKGLQDAITKKEAELEKVVATKETMLLREVQLREEIDNYTGRFYNLLLASEGLSIEDVINLLKTSDDTDVSVNTNTNTSDNEVDKTIPLPNNETENIE